MKLILSILMICTLQMAHSQQSLTFRQKNGKFEFNTSKNTEQWQPVGTFGQQLVPYAQDNPAALNFIKQFKNSKKTTRVGLGLMVLGTGFVTWGLLKKNPKDGTSSSLRLWMLPTGAISFAAGAVCFGIGEVRSDQKMKKAIAAMNRQ